MFKSPTVFVIGAGASAEAKLPIGSDLTQQIADLVDLEITTYREITKGDRRIGAALLRLADDPVWQPNGFQGSGRAIAEAMQLAPSIDTFLESHASNREYVLLGKLGIARAIAVAESKSALAPATGAGDSATFSMNKLTGTWYKSLAQQLFTGIFATAFQMSPSDVKVVRNQIAYLLRGRPERSDEGDQTSINIGTCQDLFASYWRSLTA